MQKEQKVEETASSSSSSSYSSFLEEIQNNIIVDLTHFQLHVDQLFNHLIDKLDETVEEEE